MEIISAVFELFIDFWWLFLALVFGVFGLVIYKIYFEKNEKNKNEKDDEENEKDDEDEKLFKTFPSDEERILNIDFAKKDVETELDNIEKLVEKLKTGKPFVARAIDAIYFADNLESEINLSDGGVLVISESDSKSLIKKIMSDPLDIVRYVQSMKKLIDVDNTKNKIPLGDVLHMFRNAKNFGLYTGKENIERKDTELLVKLKTEIYHNYFTDVNIGYMKEKQKQKNKGIESGDFTIVNTAKKETKEKETKEIKNKDEEHIDPKTNLVVDPTIDSVELLEDGKVKIVQNGIETIKDDFKTYQFTDLNEVLNDDNPKNNKMQNNSFSASQPTAFENEVKVYQKEFGELSQKEKEYLEKNKTTDKLKYRLKRDYDNSLMSKIEFSIDAFNDGSMFGVDEKIEILSEIFSSKNYRVKTIESTKKIDLLYEGQINLRGKEEKRFLAINADYIISLVYAMIKSENKESFYKEIYNSDESINEKVFESTIKSLETESGIFFKPKGKSYLNDIAYQVNEYSVFGKIVNLDLDIFNDVLEKIIRNSFEKTDLENNRISMMKELSNNAKAISFGEKAKIGKWNYTITNKYFFQKKKAKFF